MAEAVRKHEGIMLDYTAGANISAGQVIVGTARCFVATRDIANGELGSIYTSGVFFIPKTTGTAWTLGQQLYWDDSANKGITTDSSGTHKALGKAAAAAASGDATGYVLLGA